MARSSRSSSSPTRDKGVLQTGGSMSANDLVKNFLGRAQNIAAFQHWLGQEFGTETANETGSKN
jgi:Zn-dependent oligopeptidase